ncbi:MAG: hypothetical protein ACI3VS_01085 [Evtepia sp.]
MYEPILPQGAQAALMPGAAYSVPGLFLYSSLVYQCLDQVEAKFGYRIPVRYLYGSPQARWNCGRPVIVDHGYTMEDIQAELQGALDRGITPLLTFSMPRMTQRDLEDPLGNAVLDLLNRLGGGVIVSSPLLRDHIRANYPNIELHASVIMTSFEENRDEAYYESLARDYSRYVVHPDDNYDLDLLARLPKDRAEIMLNERCVRHCAQRGEHYLTNTQDQAVALEGTGQYTGFLRRCPFVPDYKQQTTPARNISLTGEEARALADLGFGLFKLQGRLDIPYAFFFDFLRYTLENEVAFPAMYPPFCFAIRAWEREKAKRRKETP